MLWLTHYIIFTQTTQLAAAPSPAVPVDSIVFVGSFRLILYTNSLRQNRNRNRNRNREQVLWCSVSPLPTLIEWEEEEGGGESE